LVVVRLFWNGDSASMESVIATLEPATISEISD
jgi:hypothetical protein